MDIKLDDKHILKCDEYCYWIAVMVEGEKAKKPYERRCSGYAATFEQAVESFIDRRIRAAEIDNLKKLTKEIKDLKAEVRGWQAAVGLKRGKK